MEGNAQKEKTLMYVPYHVHSMYSNCTTNIDSVVKFERYIEAAKKLGMPAFGFAEHGNIFHWLFKKEAIEAAGMKYIHAEEFYLTSTIDEKIRDNYHCVLIAKNFDGVKELNSLFTRSYNLTTHYYYNPRITFDELFSTSDNIIVTTACLGGVLNRNERKIQKNNIHWEQDLKRFSKFLINNKHRCYLEIQHHNTPDQKKYNENLLKFGRDHGIPLIVGTDTHSLTTLDAEARMLYQKSKGIYFDGEDNFDLIWKSPEELLEAYRKQGSLPDDVVLEAMTNSVKMAESIEPFEMDYSAKYPKLFKDSKGAFIRHIRNGVKWRGIDQLPNYEDYQKRINEEFKTFVHNDAVDFMLLEEDYKKQMRKQGIRFGYSRGSVSGSLIAYVLGITEIDSLKNNLNFERFMNRERVSLADIDTDWYSEDQPKVKNYLHQKDGLYCSDIVTFNTVDLKGAIDDVGRGLGMSVSDTAAIKKLAESDEKKARDQFPELFKYVDVIRGCIISMGNHPSACIVSPHPIDDVLGLCQTKSDPYPVCCLNMKEIDKLKYVKLDVLGLDTVGLIYKTCDAAGIDYLTPNNTPGDDIEVWNSIKRDTTCIFQWESDMATDYIKRLFSESTLEKVKKVYPAFKYIDLFSIGNAALRPAGASYRDSIARGEFNDLGHPALNKYFASTFGRMVYQEQLMGFLHEFCGYTMGQADIVRRGFAKKTGTEQFIPDIKAGFIKTMKDQYNVSEEDSEKLITDFLVVIEDASDYLFSKNHSDPYSWIGYICGYLRYHYPLEFLTTALNIYEKKQNKTVSIVGYLKKIGIHLEPIKFRQSRGEYSFDREQNTIFKGLKSIKYLSDGLAENLYALRNNTYDSFIDLLYDIDENKFADTRQIKILIKLDYFREFGDRNQLLEIYGLFDRLHSRKTLRIEDIEKCGIPIGNVACYAKRITAKQLSDLDMRSILKELSDHVIWHEANDLEIASYEYDCLGYVNQTCDPVKSEAVVLGVDTKYSPKIQIYSLKTGLISTLKISKKYFETNELHCGDLIKNLSGVKKIKTRKDPISNKWVEDENGDKEYWLKKYSIVTKPYEKVVANGMLIAQNFDYKETELLKSD